MPALPQVTEHNFNLPPGWEVAFATREIVGRHWTPWQRPPTCLVEPPEGYVDAEMATTKAYFFHNEEGKRIPGHPSSLKKSRLCQWEQPEFEEVALVVPRKGKSGGI